MGNLGRRNSKGLGVDDQIGEGEKCLEIYLQ